MSTLNSDIEKAFQKTVKELHHCFILKEQIENTFFNFLKKDYTLSEEHKELLSLYISTSKIEAKIKIKENDFDPRLKDSDLSLACSVLVDCFQKKLSSFSFNIKEEKEEPYPEKKIDYKFSKSQSILIQNILYEDFKKLQEKYPEECEFGHISNRMYEMWRNINRKGLNVMLTSQDFEDLHEIMKTAYKNTMDKKNNDSSYQYSYVASGILNRFYSGIIIEFEDNSLKLFFEKEKELYQYD
jgi:hypothetical protein